MRSPWFVGLSKLSVFWLPVAAAASVVGVTGCQESARAVAAEGEQSALLVRVAAVETVTEYAVEREYVGRVEARRQAQVGFELGGELAAVAVDEGDRVKAGAVLARLDTARLEARRAEARAALEQAKSASEYAERSRERNEVAADFDGISAQELDLAVDRANAASAGLAAAEARLATVEVDLSKSALRAPFAAVVVRRRFDEGQIVAAGQPVLDVQELAPPDVRVGVAGELINELHAGDTRALRVNGRDVSATVRAVLPVRDPATRTVDVIFALEDVDVLPGDLARLVLEQPIAEIGAWLPVSALAEGSRGLWTAYVAIPVEDGPIENSGATHYIEPRPVEVLYERADAVFVRGALNNDELFVTGGLTRVVPNQQVRIDVKVAASDAEVESR